MFRWLKSIFKKCENNCPFCSDEECIVNKPYTVVYITENELRNHTQTPDGASIQIDYKINYCPMCGRKLENY